MVISHTKEEFIMDFLMVAAPAGTVTSRVIVSPGHIKRIVAALNENIAKYETMFGEIQLAEEPKANIGFINFDKLIKSRKAPLFVIPAKAGIQ